MFSFARVYRRYFQDGCLIENQKGTLVTIKSLPNPPTTKKQYTQFQKQYKDKMHKEGAKDVSHRSINDATCECSNSREVHVLNSSLHPAVDFLWRGHWIAPGWGQIGAGKLEAEV